MSRLARAVVGLTRCVALGSATAFVLLALAVALTPLPSELRERAVPGSIRVEDRDGHLLREVRASDASRARFTPLAECGGRVLDALIAAEDRRFYAHPGVDPVAALRAAFTDARRMRIVSGASTITMQLARTLRPHPRGAWGKVRDVLLALRIELSLSKPRILEQYVNRAPFGPGLRGLAAASHAYFDKGPDRLSAAEAALLAGMPRSPSLYDPIRRPERATLRRARVLARMQAAGMISAEARERAEAEPLGVRTEVAAFGAPHFVHALASGALDGVLGAEGVVRSTLDGRLQRAAEIAVGNTVARVRGKNLHAAAVLVLENDTGDVLAYVGSPDFWSEADGGQNDGVRAKRQPGSALKPFLYELALERLGYDAATLLPDVELHVPVAGGDFAPRDYDGRFHGPIRLREALGNSLNVPAVWTALEVGVPAFLEHLRALGFDSLTESPDYYGPALALGDGEVSLLELTRGYATLARGGTARPIRTRGAELAPATRVLSALAVSQITGILEDRHARLSSFGEDTALDFPFPVAAKTGTSKGYRDNWAVGYTRDVTVGVWVGNFDGSPMNGTTGLTGAGPIFHEVMMAAMRARLARPLGGPEDLPVGLVRTSVCPLSGARPGAACPHHTDEWLPADHVAMLPTCEMHVRARIDRQNGLLAGPSCPASDAEERVFESYPAEYRGWASVAARPVAPEEGSPRCPPPQAEPKTTPSDLRIVYPLDGARFVLDPDQPLELQQLPIQVAVPSGVRAVDLRVDGRSLGIILPPFRASWPLVAGRHVLVAAAPGSAEGRSVAFEVRGER